MRMTALIGRLCTRRVLALAILFAFFAPGILGPISKSTGNQGFTAAAQATSGVVIQGNRRIETATILSYMQLPTDREVTAGDLNAAVQRLFDTGLFRDALDHEVGTVPDVGHRAHEDGTQ